MFLVINFIFLFSNIGQQERIYCPIKIQVIIHWIMRIISNLMREMIYIPDAKLAELEEGNIWIQVLDENGTEIYSRFKPEDAPIRLYACELDSLL